MVDALQEYVQRGKPLNSFLAAVVSNDFAGACARADGDNLENLPAFGSYLLHVMPQAAWGSHEKVADWLASHALARRGPEA